MLNFLALAALVAAPETDKSFSAALLEGFPTWALAADKSAAAVVSLWVDADGKIYDCKTLGRVGDERLANEICRLVPRRRILPAADHTGASAVGNIVTLIKLTLPGTAEGDKISAMVQSPDLTIEVNRLPSNLASPYNLELAVEVDLQGQVVACNGGKESDRALAGIACERLAAEQFERAADKKGKPTSYVRTFKARFLSSQVR